LLRIVSATLSSVAGSVSDGAWTGEPVDQPVDVAEPVQVVEVDVRHDAGVGQRNVVVEELAPEIGAEVDE